MKLPFLAALLVCGCITSFRAQAVSYEYDWSFSSDSTYTGQIFLNAASGNTTLPATLPITAPIVSYDIVANGTTFSSANSTLVGVLGSSIIWNTAGDLTIDTMDLQITLNSNPSDILSVTDGTINGAGGNKTVGGEWDAAPASVPDFAYTLPLFAIGLASLGWYYYILLLQQRRQLAVAVVKQ